MILHNLINEGVESFEEAQLYYGHGTGNSWDEVVMLVSHALKLPPNANETVLQRVLTRGEIATIRDLFQQRIEHKVPAAYLTGHGAFAGMEFIVTPDVLVPRSPFAELIANRFSPWLLRDPQKILDLCTGSGCIGIATAFSFPESNVDLVDISPEAIAVAQRNINKHDVAHRINAIESDLFAALKGRTYDLIVCNPPYVNAADFASMPDEYHAEPALGLESGADGLDFTRQLLIQASEYLSDGGCLFVEVGNSWEALEQVYSGVPFTWLEFEWGGHGVFVMTAEQLREHHAEFAKGARIHS